MSSADELKQILVQATTVAQLGVSSSLAIDSIYRILFAEGDVSVGRIVEITHLYPQIIDDLMAELQYDHLVDVVKAGAMRVSYTYRLTDEGMSRARDAMERTQYIGPFPVDIEAYRQALIIQTDDRRQVTPAEVKRALAHLTLPDSFHRQIGPAMNSGSSLFLYGPPGNGKTSVAQAIAQMLSSSDPIWLPYAITVGGQIIQVYDPMLHIPFRTGGDSESTTGKTSYIGVDKRWGLFHRPAVMVGGELTLEALELRFEPTTKIYEAPLQLKANGGMFLIDDFGRQPMSPRQLLNRWIVPLETRVDYLRLHSGQTLEIPFRQLIVFATNLDPADLVDAAFLRRIQMKVEVGAPDEMMFYQILVQWCQAYHIPFDKDGFVHLLQKWYREAKRPMQAVHPRDLLKIIVAICEYENTPPLMAPDWIDEACRCYFVDHTTPC